jgi:hypothetical protein
VRGFFRFSIREFLVLVVCFAVCVAVNRRNDFSLLSWLVGVALLTVVVSLIVFAPSILIASIRLYRPRERRDSSGPGATGSEAGTRDGEGRHFTG